MSGREPVAGELRVGTELHVRRALRLDVEMDRAVDVCRVRDEKLVALVQLATTHDALEAGHVVDLIDSSHDELVRRNQLQTPGAPDAVESTTDSRLVIKIIIK